MLGLGAKLRERHLVGAKRPLAGQAVDRLGARPALRRDEHDHRPARPRRLALLARSPLDLGDLLEHRVERRRHQLVHDGRLVTLDEMRRVAVTVQQRRELLARNPREHRRVGDLVAVEVKHRQHGAVLHRIEELVRVPARRQRAGLGLAVTDHAQRDQSRVVEHGAVGVQQRVAQFAALVDRPGGLRSDVAGDPAGEGELAKEPLDPLLVVADLRVDLAVGALQVGVGDDARPTVTGAGDEDRIEVAGADRPVHVRVDEVEAGSRAPVAEQPRLDVVDRQRLAQERVGEQVDLPDREIVGGPPVGIDQGEVLLAERGLGRRCRSVHVVHMRRS